uniref:Calpain catalytic domain-containing protein n=1 Tax=Cyprinus carpio TaxID=7962 RepID=A0A8C1RIS4_CYPCA
VKSCLGSFQDYQSLKQECLAKGTLFYDPTFPAESDSLGYNELGQQSPMTIGVEWKRPKVQFHCGWRQADRHLPRKIR